MSLVRRPLQLTALADPAGPLLEWVLPVRVSDEDGALLTVVAMWASNQDAVVRHPPAPVDRQATQAAAVYREHVVTGPPTVVIGDFNNGPAWLDASQRRGWSDTLAAWEEHGLVQHGDESSLSYNQKGKRYWIDHLLAPKAVVTSCAIHAPDGWDSDHGPVVAHLSLPRALIACATLPSLHAIIDRIACSRPDRVRTDLGGPTDGILYPPDLAKELDDAIEHPRG